MTLRGSGSTSQPMRFESPKYQNHKKNTDGALSKENPTFYILYSIFL